MNTKQSGNKSKKSELREHLEANLLDGQSVYDCGKAIFYAEDILDYLMEYCELKAPNVKGVKAWGLKSTYGDIHMVRMEISTLIPYVSSKDKIVPVLVTELPLPRPVKRSAAIDTSKKI